MHFAECSIVECVGGKRTRCGHAGQPRPTSERRLLSSSGGHTSESTHSEWENLLENAPHPLLKRGSLTALLVSSAVQFNISCRTPNNIQLLKIELNS